MLFIFRIGIRSPVVYNQQRFNLYRNVTLEMGTQIPSKRPVCRSCSKPIRLCLCSRFKTPLFDNSISVTILQHSQERNHPLNSTRIATLGLKNLTVATVSDVHFEARFIIRSLKPGFGTESIGVEEKSNGNHSVNFDSDQVKESPSPQELTFGSNLRNGCVDNDTHVENSRKNRKISDFEQIQGCSGKKKTERNAMNGFTNDIQNCPIFPVFLTTTSDDHEFINKESRDKCGSVEFDLISASTAMEAISDVKTMPTYQNQLQKPNIEKIQMNSIGEEEADISATIAKCGFTCSLTRLRTPQCILKNPNFDQLLATQVGQDAISNGFIVKKLQRMQMDGSVEYEEFKIVVPPGSALLFPTKKSISLEAVDFEVKHLIVLDGTWAKAKRMFHENPWLKLLPHLKLDINKTSLYSEVRHEPKVGCLSTIESIVCAFKALGDDREELDNLLDVFESMVVDQRRCKDERLSKVSST